MQVQSTKATHLGVLLTEIPIKHILNREVVTAVGHVIPPCQWGVLP